MKSKAPLLLMEQMIMLLVFSLAAALCLQAFVKSDASSRRIQNRDAAVNLVQNVAEVARSRVRRSESMSESPNIYSSSWT